MPREIWKRKLADEVTSPCKSKTNEFTETLIMFQ